MLPPFTAALALELAPVRVNLIQAAFVDTALAASYFADETAVEARRDWTSARPCRSGASSDRPPLRLWRFTS